MKWIDRYFQSKIDTIHSEVNKAEVALSKRLEGMNEFRDTLKDQAAQLATRIEVDRQLSTIDERIKSLELSRANVEGKAAIVASVVSIVTSAITALLISYLIRG
jgi:hypothetical protein